MLRPRSVLLALLTLLCLSFATPAWAAGLLVPRDGSPPIEVESQRVTATLVDGLARTTVRQTFVNPNPRALEALYVFPVPTGATLVDVAMEVGGQRLEGLVVERQKARRVYDSIVRRREDPALVEQIGRSKFRLSVFPVLPGQPTVVELTWIEHVPLTEGTYRYVYPLALAGSDTQTNRDLTFALTVESSAPIVSATSPTADVDVVRRGPGNVLATMERVRARLNSDIVVETAVAVGEPSLDVRTFRDAKGNGYFAAVVTPPMAKDEQRIPRDITLLLDTSGSMQGPKFDQALLAARHLIDGAHANDRVNIVPFASAVEPFAEAPVSVSDESRALLHAFLDGLAAQGSTALGDAVAFVGGSPAARGRVRTVVLLTDGRPTIGETDATKIIESAQVSGATGTRFFTFGVGEDVDSALLEGIGKTTRGTAEVFRPGGEIASRITRFLHRTAVPVMADLVISGDGAQLLDILPRPLPDVHLGEQAVLTGRFRGEGDAHIVVSGRLANRGFQLKRKVTLPSSAAGSVAVRDLWARRKIDYLESALRLRSGLADDAYYAALDSGSYSTSDEIVQEIVNVSIHCAVQSAYASFLVLLPEDKARLDPRDLASLQSARERAAERRQALSPRRPPERVADSDRPIEEMEKGVEDPVVKDAKVFDHNETDDDMDDETSFGDPRFNSDAPFEGPGTNGTIGIGGGAGGAFGGRRGGRRNLRAGGGGRKTQGAVDLALEWLKNHQSPDGRWDGDGFDSQCKLNKCSGPGESASDPGQTGLALLCFLGAGETHNSGQYKETVKKGLRYLKGIQDAEGCFGPQSGPQWQYDNLCAALAMTEAYGLTGSRLFKEPAQRAVNFVHKSQNPYLGWGRGVRSGDNDTTLTGWAVMVLKSAKMADLDVDQGAFRGAVNWVEKMTDPESGRVGEQRRGARPVRPQELLGRFPARYSEAPTAAGLLVRIFSGQDPAGNDFIQEGAELVSKQPPRWDVEAGTIDFTHWYFGTLAMFQVGGKPWTDWRGAMEEAIVSQQRKELGRDERGSWDPVGAWGRTGGRVTSTALNCLSLEVYYRYGRVFGADATRTR